MFRKLRIAFSAMCLIACVLLIALWVRSYSKADSVCRAGKRELLTIVESDSGSICFNSIDYQRIPHRLPIEPHGWEYAGNDVDADIELPALKFKWDLGATDLTIQVPHWFALSIIATIAAVPWIPWSKRFSLRTLLIATTLIAMGMGAIVYLAGK